MSIESENLETARRYFEAIENGAGSEAMAEFFTPDIVQVEFPNTQLRLFRAVLII